MCHTSEAFNDYAHSYDQHFTESEIGKLQRQRIRDFILPLLLKTELTILELNCGTGEDAIWLANLGHHVEAIDISEEMIVVAESKKLLKNAQNVNFHCMGFNQVQSKFAEQKFDLVFSNFGGLNCINQAEMNQLSSQLSQLINPGAVMVFVLMGKYCLWEIGYFLLKASFSKAMRRCTSDGVPTIIGDREFETWYYSVSELKDIFNHHFKMSHAKPLAFFTPPSYLEKYFIKHPKRLQKLNKADNTFCKFKQLSDFSDHFVVQFQLRPHI